jgi:hypothetical protein
MIGYAAKGRRERSRIANPRFGGARLALPALVILFLAGVGLWRGAFEDTHLVGGTIPLRAGLSPDEKMTAFVDGQDLPKASRMYAELTGRELIGTHASLSQRLDRCLNGRLVRWGLVRMGRLPDNGICYHRDGRFSAIEIKRELEELFQSEGLCPVSVGKGYYRLVRRSLDANTGD